MSASEYLLVEVTQQPIELCKLLKIADLVSGGGEAKVVISEGYVFLNGEVEYQKRKKIYHEDVIEFNGEVIQLIVNESLDNSEHAVEDSQLVEENSSMIMPSQSLSISQTEKKSKKQNKNGSINTSPTKKTQSQPKTKNTEQPISPHTPAKRRPISF